MEREYTYAELCRMTKKRVVKLAGYRNIKHALKDGINKQMSGFDPMTKKPVYITVNCSKKYLARLIASDK